MEDNPVTDWHVYSVDWTPENLFLKLMEECILYSYEIMAEKYGKWAFDNPKTSDFKLCFRR